MNKDQGTGILERVVYGAAMYAVMTFGQRFGLSPDDAAWVAGGAVALVGGVWGWWHNRPVSVLNRAAAAIPQEAKLVITTLPDASHADKLEAGKLASAANDKVIVANS